MTSPSHGLDTRLVHGGEEPRVEGAVSLPIFQTSTYLTRGSDSYHDIRYVRLSTSPNHLALGRKLAEVEGAEAAIVTASGMAAISTTLLTLLGAGDHLIAHRTLYGGTLSLLVGDLAKLGITCSFVDLRDASAIDAHVRPETRAIYTEAITNPLTEVPDLVGVVRAARAHDLISVVDATFASPVNLRPVELGYDLVVHSATKYLGGHSDVAAGVVAGRESLVGRVKQKLDHLGGALDPHAAFLLHRGMKTLGLRVRRQGANALALAEALEAHPQVAWVRYPGLASHPDHGRAAELLDGFGGMLAFEPRPEAGTAPEVVGRLRLALDAPSLGGLETLVSIPALVSHVQLSPAAKAELGLTEATIRVSVGIEDPADIIVDFDQALRGG
jgi:cystathionine gamma-synthase/cystathionine gamma-lyase/cystathionine beta-lyase